MGKRGACSSDECPRGYGKITEDKQHLFQCSKGNNKCDKLKKILLEWGERNRAAPQIISAILHGISKWRKGQMPSNPPPQPLDVARDFENQTNIGWLQALIGLTEGSWDEIQNMHLQLLEKKTTGKRWISYLLRKLWDTAWYFWSFWNHTLHATDIPRKTEILDMIDKKVTLHINKGITGLPSHFHFMFPTSIHTLINCPVRQCLSWMASTSSARICSFPPSPQHHHTYNNIHRHRLTTSRKKHYGETYSNPNKALRIHSTLNHYKTSLFLLHFCWKRGGPKSSHRTRPWPVPCPGFEFQIILSLDKQTHSYFNTFSLSLLRVRPK